MAGGGGAEFGGVEALEDGGGEGESAGVGDVVGAFDGVFAFVKAVDIEGVVAVVDGDIIAEATGPAPTRGGADGFEAGGTEVFKLHIL